MSLDKLGKPETFIGIDQSYSGFGLVVLRENDEDINLWKFPPEGSESYRLLGIYLKLYRFFVEERSKGAHCIMAMEGYAHGSKFNREKLGELGGIVKLAWRSVFETDPVIVSPTVLKKYMTGKGTASKDQMLEAARIFNPDVKNHNVADAYGLALYVKEYNATFVEKN